MQISSIGVISHPKLDPKHIKEIIKIISSRNTHLFFDPYTAKKIGRESTDVKDMDVTVAIILGGDGTVLWSVRKLKNGTPILPINAGEVGYLSEIDIKDAKEGIERLLNGDFYVENRAKLMINKKYEVLNELIIYPSDPATLLEFNIRLDSIEIANFRSDGVLVSTPTGSTAYSFSLGNPIIHPDTKAYIISPICPLMRDQAPLIVPDKSKTEIELRRKEKDANLILDGRCKKKLSEGDKISVEKSKNTADFIRFTKDFSYHYIRRRRDERK